MVEAGVKPVEGAVGSIKAEAVAHMAVARTRRRGMVRSVGVYNRRVVGARELGAVGGGAVAHKAVLRTRRREIAGVVL